MIGGVCINTGTIPSKTLREAVLYLTGLSQRELYGQSYRLKDEITVADLAARTQHVIGREIDVIRSQLARNHVQMLHRHRPVRRPAHDRGRPPTTARERKVTAEKIVIAAGTRPARPASCGLRRPHDRRLRRRSSTWTTCRASMVVVGAGVIGIEYASMFAALGTKVTVVERRDRMLEFCDLEIVEALKYHLRDLAVTFRFGETVAAVERHERRRAHPAGERQADRRRHGHVLGRPAGRRPTSSTWTTAGLEADDRGRIKVDDALPHRGRRTSTRSAT